MDRFKKVVDIVRSKWRAFLRVYWQNVPEDDYFRTVDLAFNVAGMIYEPTNGWERICWRVYRSFAVFDYCVLLLETADHLYLRTDFFSTIWPLLKFGAVTMAVVRNVIFWRYYDTIVQSRNFINSKGTTSDNADFDYNLRKQFFQRTQAICFMMFGTIGILIPLAPILIAPDDKLFGLPRQMLEMDPWALRMTHILFMTTLFIIWGHRNLAPFVIASALLDGYKTDLRIFEQATAELADHVPWNILEQRSSSAGSNKSEAASNRQLQAQRSAQLLDEFWIDFTQRVRIKMEQHVQLVEHLQQFENCVEELFLAVYYTALIMFGALIYAPVVDGVNKGTALALLGLAVYFAECCWWCILVESLRDINEPIEGNILELILRLPYAPAHHSDYVQMRSTLMILKLNVGNTAQFDCYEIITISNELFCELINTVYSVLTFLLNMDLDR